MDLSPRFSLPLIMASQAQKHLTHNEALVHLESLVQPVVLDLAASEPPAHPEEMDCVIVSAGATGDFAGQDQSIAAWIADAWHFFTPQTGWSVVLAAETKAYVFDGAAWVSLVDAAVEANLSQVGIMASASTANRLTVASDASLLTAEHQDHRLTINKADPTATASIVFQSAWSGRAEMGLAGHDGFAVKVSSDGGAWVEALAIDGANGVVSMPQRPVAQAFLSGGSSSYSAGLEIGFDGLTITQGEVALGTPLIAPSTGAGLVVPASGYYACTLVLSATELGTVSLVLNGSTLALQAQANLTGTDAQTFQLNGLVNAAKDDVLTLRFDDAASVECSAQTCWLSLFRL